MSSSPKASTRGWSRSARGATAELLAEMIAALVYHYEPDAAGGTAVTDVCINDGDFVVTRRRDGTFDVRLTAPAAARAASAPACCCSI